MFKKTPNAKPTLRTVQDSQRAAGQGEANAQQNPQPQAPTYGALWVLECASASPWSAARCQSMRLALELALRPELILEISRIVHSVGRRYLLPVAPKATVPP